MSVVIYFGMVGMVILVGVTVIVSTLVHWKRHGLPKPPDKRP